MCHHWEWNHIRTDERVAEVERVVEEETAEDGSPARDEREPVEVPTADD